MKIFRFKLVFILFLLINQVIAEERVQGRRSLVLENEIARLVIDIAGGSIPEFRFNNSKLNPLNWGSRNSGDQPGTMGHFLCCDLWSDSAATRPAHAEERQRWLWWCHLR